LVVYGVVSLKGYIEISIFEQIGNFVYDWTVIFDFMFQLNAPLLYYIYHIPLHVSSNIMLIETCRGM